MTDEKSIGAASMPAELFAFPAKREPSRAEF